MPGLEESLFSLELVVEKLYIPHVVCRFPAVAFRLLDFPTIVINHVEDELGKAIRRQISFDPDYEIPQQFSELKDKHGNFMVKKGKSCLFKMVAETLKNHLSSTPLYVMVIDMFPEVPKLVGNSTVPLNVLMDAVCADLVRLGPTVPSVHGDKGLFKIYNLMGKEIGYFVLGFRLLCLGPSLIPHLPEAALVKRQSKKQTQQQKRENRQMVEMVQMGVGDDKEEEEEEEGDLIETRNTGSMTDVIKHDVLMQTVEMDDKAVHVEMQAPVSARPSAPVAVLPVREIHTAATQTDKKGIKTVMNVKKKILEDLAALDEHDEDEVIVTNIVCPPPLFYNSQAKPHVEVDNDSYSLDTDMSVSDDLTVDSLTDEEADELGSPVSKKVPAVKEAAKMDLGAIVSPPAATSYEDVIQSRDRQTRKKADVHPHSQGQGLPGQVPVGFPLLSALINELLSIQGPGLLQGAVSQLQTVAATPQQFTQAAYTPGPRQVQPTGAQKEAPSPAGPGEAAVKEGADREEADVLGDLVRRKGHRECVHPEPGVPKSKSWLRVTPQPAKKNSKLMFGLTLTQRLRLQKTNPSWLHKMERAVSATKTGEVRRARDHDAGEDLNATNFSDTLTEVRRLAQKELEKTAANDTMQSVKDFNNSGTLMATPKKHRSRSQGKSSPKKPGKASGIPPGTPSPRPRRHQQKRRSQSERRYSDESDGPARPMSVEKGGSSIESPDLKMIPPPSTGEADDVPMSARSDLPSSRSRSIEVRLPSAQAGPDDDSEATLSDSEEEEALPLPDDSYNQDRRNSRGLSFPSYLRQGAALPDSIEGRPNQSLNTTTGLDENSPLESTRNSKIYGGDERDSRNMQSTDDLDTRQFHSTSEPELQGLGSDEEQEKAAGDRQKTEEGVDRRFPIVNPMLSQQSPVPSMRHSMAKLDLSRSQIPITPRGDTPRSSRSGSASPKRPTPRPRRPLRDWRESVHTDSVSSYMPSDPDMPASFSSGEGNYSEDFLEAGSGASTPSKIAQLDKPRIIPSAKLGYTIS